MKNLFRELTLPAFWLLVFIILPRNESRDNQLKNADSKVPIVIGIKKQDRSSAGATNTINKNKDVIVTKVSYLSAIRF